MSNKDNDPLAAWRSSNEEPLPAAAGEKMEYTAFDNPADRSQPRLHLCPLEHEAWEWMPYLDLHRIVHDGPHETRLGLIWSYAVVVISGRNLKLLHHHIASEVMREIRAFDPKRFHNPVDPTAPFIDSIIIKTESRQAMLEEEVRLLSDIKHRH